MSDVSRETSGLQDYYRDNAELNRFAEILATVGVERGLIGPREADRIWPRHIANCAVVAQGNSGLIPQGAHVIDVGSGAGLPGVVWALVRGDLTVTLLEPLLRRATFLAEVVDGLGIGSRVDVKRERAEDFSGALGDVVTARAVAPMPTLASWTLPLTRRGGLVVAFKGATASAELNEARGVIDSLGGADGRVLHFGEGLLDRPTGVVVITKVASVGKHKLPGGRTG